MDPRVMPKVAPSDAVQETFLEAQRDFPNFRGATPDDLKSWLRQILLNNIANWQRHYLATAKRCIERERPLADPMHSGNDGDCLIADSTAPTARAIRNEESQRLEQAMKRLSPNDRLVIELRHMEQLSFAEIGAQTGRSADAARMSWWRAFERLAGFLENHDGGQHSPLSN
jgi:RNA polymerase sigma-70 factor (ECF subfamily)